MLLTEDELLERRLDEPGAIDEGAALLGATLERTLLEELVVVPLKWVARREVALMPLVLLIR